MANTSGSTVRVALADDHRVFAEALGALLDAEPELDFVGHAQTAQQTLHLLGRQIVDVLLLDLDVAGIDGLDLGRQVLARWPRVRLVVLTGSPDEDRLSEAVQMGARGWVVKSGGMAGLVAAVLGAARDETHIPADVLTRLLDTMTAKSSAANSAADTELLARLSDRERDVLDGLVAGKSRQQIGSWLGLSSNTVRTHVQNILRKLNVDSALSAVALVRRAVE